MDGSTAAEKLLGSTNDTSKEECEAACRSDENCCSFAWSPTWRTCQLSPECFPTGPAHGDFIFCRNKYFIFKPVSVPLPGDGDAIAVNVTAVSEPAKAEIVEAFSNSTQTIEVLCCSVARDGGSAFLLTVNGVAVRTCGNNVSCADICDGPNDQKVTTSDSEDSGKTNICV